MRLLFGRPTKRSASLYLTKDQDDDGTVGHFYGRDPLYRWLYQWHGNDAIIALIFIAAFLVPTACVSIMNGTFTSSSLAYDYRNDLSIVTAKILQIGSLLEVTGVKSPTLAASPPLPHTTFVYLRDYLNLLGMIVGAITISRIYRQWDGLVDIPAKLRQNSSFRSSLTENEFADIRSEFRAPFVEGRFVAAALAVAGVTAVVMFWTISSNGMFSLMSPTGDRLWELDAYQGWWARPRLAQPLSILAAVLVGLNWLLIFYYSILANFIGAEYVRRLGRVFKRYHGARLFAVQPEHPDGLGGLGEVREAVIQIVVLVVLYGFLIALGLGYISLQSALFFSFFYFLWLVMTQVYVWIPLSLFGSVLREHKDTQLLRLHQHREAIRKSLVGDVDSTGEVAFVTSAPASSEYQRLAIVEAMYRGTTAMPDSLFSGPRKVLSTVFAVAPAVIGTLMAVAQRLHTLTG